MIVVNALASTMEVTRKLRERFPSGMMNVYTALLTKPISRVSSLPSGMKRIVPVAGSESSFRNAF